MGTYSKHPPFSGPCRRRVGRDRCRDARSVSRSPDHTSGSERRRAHRRQWSPQRQHPPSLDCRSTAHWPHRPRRNRSSPSTPGRMSVIERMPCKACAARTHLLLLRVSADAVRHLRQLGQNVAAEEHARIQAVDAVAVDEGETHAQGRIARCLRVRLKTYYTGNAGQLTCELVGRTNH